METNFIKFADLLKEEIAPAFPVIEKTIKFAYELAWHRGRESHRDGSTTLVYAAQLESIRLPDEQGIAVESGLYEELGEGFDFLDARFEANKKKRHHLEIHTGRLLLTCHRVRHPKDFPRQADYRRSNARSNQLWLPDCEYCNDVDEKTYCFILHGPAENMRDLGFIRLCVPDSETKSYLAWQDLYMHTDFKCSVKQEEIPNNVVLSLKSIKTKIAK